MPGLIPIQSLTADDVRNVIRCAVNGSEVDNATINDFVASVDWSDFNAATDETEASLLLSRLEAAAGGYDEEDISVLGYIDRLLSMLVEEWGDRDSVMVVSVDTSRTRAQSVSLGRSFSGADPAERVTPVS